MRLFDLTEVLIDWKNTHATEMALQLLNVYKPQGGQVSVGVRLFGEGGIPRHKLQVYFHLIILFLYIFMFKRQS